MCGDALFQVEEAGRRMAGPDRLAGWAPAQNERHGWLGSRGRPRKACLNRLTKAGHPYRTRLMDGLAPSSADRDRPRKTRLVRVAKAGHLRRTNDSDGLAPSHGQKQVQKTRPDGSASAGQWTPTQNGPLTKSLPHGLPASPRVLTSPRGSRVRSRSLRCIRYPAATPRGLPCKCAPAETRTPPAHMYARTNPNTSTPLEIVCL